MTRAALRLQHSVRQKVTSAIRKERRPLMGYTDQRFDVNLSILFTELPLLERPAAAAAAGFTAVELWWPLIDTPTPPPAEPGAL